MITRIAFLAISLTICSCSVLPVEIYQHIASVGGSETYASLRLASQDLSKHFPIDGDDNQFMSMILDHYGNNAWFAFKSLTLRSAPSSIKVNVILDRLLTEIDPLYIPVIFARAKHMNQENISRMVLEKFPPPLHLLSGQPVSETIPIAHVFWAFIGSIHFNSLTCFQTGLGYFNSILHRFPTPRVKRFALFVITISTRLVVSNHDSRITNYLISFLNQHIDPRHYETSSFSIPYNDDLSDQDYDLSYLPFLIPIPHFIPLLRVRAFNWALDFKNYPVISELLRIDPWLSLEQGPFFRTILKNDVFLLSYLFEKNYFESSMISNAIYYGQESMFERVKRYVPRTFGQGRFFEGMEKREMKSLVELFRNDREKFGVCLMKELRVPLERLMAFAVENKKRHIVEYFKGPLR